LPFPGGEALEKLYRHRYEQPTPLEQLRPETPPAVRAVVAKLMAKRPDERYQTPAALAAALASLLQSGTAAPVGIKATGGKAGRPPGQASIAAARLPGPDPFLVTSFAVVETPPNSPSPARGPKPRRWRRRAVATV